MCSYSHATYNHAKQIVSCLYVFTPLDYSKISRKIYQTCFLYVYGYAADNRINLVHVHLVAIRTRAAKNVVSVVMTEKKRHSIPTGAHIAAYASKPFS